MRTNKHLMAISVSGIKWYYVKKFTTTIECIEHLNKNKFTSVATSPHIKGKTNVVLENGNYTNKKLAVWFGNETHGMTDEAISHCSYCIQINMFGIIESMNLRVSAGVVLYEITKQRREFIKNKLKNKKQNKISHNKILQNNTNHKSTKNITINLYYKNLLLYILQYLLGVKTEHENSL